MMDTVLLCLVPVERDSDHLAHVVLVRDSFRNPHGVAVDGEGNILVADYSTIAFRSSQHKVKFLTAVGTEGSGPLQFDSSYWYCIQC